MNMCFQERRKPIVGTHTLRTNPPSRHSPKGEEWNGIESKKEKKEGESGTETMNRIHAHIRWCRDTIINTNISKYVIKSESEITTKNKFNLM